MKVRIISLILSAVLLVLSVPAYAVDENRTTPAEHIFTDAELACDTPVNSSVLSSASEDGFIPVNLIEEYMTRATTEYYITKTSNGDMLSSSATNTLQKGRYLSGYSNNFAYLKWRFSLENDGNYIVYAYNDVSVCLTVDPVTRNVTLSEDDGTQYQKWKIYYSSGGNVLQCMASDSRVSGYKLYFDNSSFYVTNTNYSMLGFITVSSFVPCTRMTAQEVYMLPGDGQYLSNIVYSPTNSNYRDGVWASYSVNSTPVCTVSDSGYLSAVSTGQATVTVTNKITSAEVRFTVKVFSSAASYNIKVYYGNPAESEYNAAAIEEIYEAALLPFYNTFRIQMNISSVSKINGLNVTCTNYGLTAICGEACGENSECSEEHCKSAVNLLQEAKSNTVYTSRFVTHAICWYDNRDPSQPEHEGINGLGATGGKNSIVTNHGNVNIACTIQHELTHNIGDVGDHSYSGERCVMVGNAGYWCTACRNAIITHRN